MKTSKENNHKALWEPLNRDIHQNFRLEDQCYKECCNYLPNHLQFQSKPNSFFPPRAEQADYKMNMNVQNDNE